MQQTEKKTIGIVGGGFLGMTLALRLREAGFFPTLLEKAEKPGGLASPCKIGQYLWDQFYHVILMSDENLLDLLGQLKVKSKMRWKKTKTSFYSGGRFSPLSNIVEFLQFPSLGIADKIRLGWTVFHASKIKSGNNLESLSAKDWLTRLSGRRTFNKIWLPLLKSKLGEGCERVNASFIWANIVRMYSARSNGSKTESFGYIEGSYETVIDRFRKVLDDMGVPIVCRAKIRRLRNTSSGVKVETDEGKVFEFEKVILTIPCSQAVGVCPELSVDERRRFSGVAYQGVISLALILKNPLGGYYITNITDAGLPFTAVIEMTALVDRENFDGNSLIYLPKYVSSEGPFWKRNDGDIRAEFINGLQKMYPNISEKDILASTIIRAPEVFPLTTLNYSKELLPPVKTSLPNIYIVNSAQIPNGTMNINEIVGLANRKTKELVQLV